MWFQNRRARYRKQERTGSVSFRSRYRQKRLEKIQQQALYPSGTIPGANYPPNPVQGNAALSIVSSPNISTTSPAAYDSSSFSFHTSFYPMAANYCTSPYQLPTASATGGASAFQYPTAATTSFFRNAPSTADGK